MGIAVLFKNPQRARLMKYQEVICGQLLQETCEAGKEKFDMFTIYASANRDASCRLFKQLTLCVLGVQPKVVVRNCNCILEVGDKTEGDGSGLDSSS